MGIIEGGYGIIQYAGDPTATAAVDAVQTLTIGGVPTAGTLTFNFQGATTDPAVTWSADNAVLIPAIQTALEGLSSIGAGNVLVAATTMLAGIGDATITFAGTLAGKPQGLVSVQAGLDGGGTASIAETTAGQAVMGVGASKGVLLIDTENAKLYQNTGTAAAPVWTER